MTSTGRARVTYTASIPEEDGEPHWGRSRVQTAFPFDCPDSCSLSVSVEEGRIVTIDGSTRHAVTDGYICAKFRRFDERVYGADRLHHPSIRSGAKGEGRFARASWNEALGLIEKRMTEIRDTDGCRSDPSILVRRIKRTDYPGHDRCAAVQTIRNVETRETG